MTTFMVSFNHGNALMYVVQTAVPSEMISYSPFAKHNKCTGTVYPPVTFCMAKTKQICFQLNVTTA